jgi:starch phosphorylase
VAAAKPHDWLAATTLAVRDHAVDRWMTSTHETWEKGDKRIYYLSLEFLIGRLLRDSLCNLGLEAPVRAALASLNVELDAIAALEPDAALGNGGLGRLAACFMESMASVDLPAYGYGIRYVNGMFRQEIADGWQAELPENWLAYGNPWEFERREASYEIGFGGSVSNVTAPNGAIRSAWMPAELIRAVAFDTPVIGWRGKRVNTLRLWKALAIESLRLDRFNAGDHLGALTDRSRAAALTRVLYPADSHLAGQELRLRQEYFFSSASIQDIVRRHTQQYSSLDNLADKVAIQLNDTHPAISVAELMRILIDAHDYDFERAWAITQATFGYTNHTLLPEALESWPVSMLDQMLPRHMQIVYAINAKLLRWARAEKGADEGMVRAISLIEEGGERRVRMGNLAFVGAHSVNGVSALHTDLMRKTVFRDLHAGFPDRINNKTNGVTPRRWLMQCNPALFALAKSVAGDELADDITRLSRLDAVAEDASFQERFSAVKRASKVRLCALVKDRVGVVIDPDALFDIQIKRIHEYKRQLLNIIETVALYDQIRTHPDRSWTPRVKIFAGKAAASYHNAKLIIKLANDVARVINADLSIDGLLKVVFLPNYNVSLAEALIPAADLSEQISTAGMEASGTGNMKFALNGAITIGTLDGANVEMRDHIGAENMMIFGLNASEVAERRAAHTSPEATISASPELKQALSAIASGVFSPDDPSRYKELVNGIREHDWFMIAADFEAYAAAQRAVDAWWSDERAWRRAAVRNVARIAWFSSDRTIREYARDIWQAPTA